MCLPLMLKFFGSNLDRLPFWCWLFGILYGCKHEWNPGFYIVYGLTVWSRMCSALPAPSHLPNYRISVRDKPLQHFDGTIRCTDGWMHEWMRMQMLAKPSSNLLQRTGGDHWGGCTQSRWRTFMMTCLHWILRYMRLQIWCKIGLSADWRLCTVLRTPSGACYYWIGHASAGKGKGKQSMAVSNMPQCSHAIWDHTVLPATRQRWHSCLYPAETGTWLSDPVGMQGWVDLVGWLVTYRDGIPAWRRSPIRRTPSTTTWRHCRIYYRRVLVFLLHLLYVFVIVLYT